MLLATSLAAWLSIVAPSHSLAQLNVLPNPCLVPVTSIYVNAYEIQALDNGGQSATEAYPSAANNAFFVDPPPNIWQGPPNNGIFNLSLDDTLRDPSENMLQLSTQTGVQGETTSIPFSYVVNGNVLYLAIPCYWRTGADCDQPGCSLQIGEFTWNLDFSYVHFQVKVEAAAWTGQGFDTTTWIVVTNAGLDILAEDWDTTDDIPPDLLAKDTVRTWNGSSWDVVQTAPSQNVFFEGELSKANGECVWVIGIVLPQVENVLHVGVQASDYTTDQDQGDYEYPGYPYWTDNKAGVLYPYGLYAGKVNTQGLGEIAGGPGDLWDYSPPFSVAILPTSVQPGDVLPIGVIYNYPGNGSSTTFDTSDSYTITMSFMDSQQNQVQSADVINQSFNLGYSLKTYFGVSLGITSGTSSTITTSETTANGSSFAMTGTLAFGQTLSAADGYWPAFFGENVTSIWQEPFWYDIIVVVPSPVIATWGPAAAGSGPPLSAAQLIGFLGSEQPNKFYFQLWSLYCAYRNSTLCPDYDGKITISPQTCQKLLQLDPFYAGSGQGQDPTELTQYSGRFVYVAPLNDIFAGEPTTFSLVLGEGSTVNSNQVSVDTTAFGKSSGLTYKLEVLGQNGISGSANNTQTTTTSITYQNQQLSTYGQTATSSGILLDAEWDLNGVYANHNNGGTQVGGFPGTSLVLYYDLVFNSFCIQDTHEPSFYHSPYVLYYPKFCGDTLPLKSPVSGNPNQVASPIGFNPNPPSFLNYPLIPPPLPLPPNPAIVPHVRIVQKVLTPTLGPTPPPTAPLTLPQLPIALQPPIVPQSPTGFSQLTISLPPIAP
jgi:hypothetical protein